MALELRRYPMLSAFRDATDDYLRANIDVCNQMFVLMRTLSDEHANDRQAWMVALYDEGRVCAVAMIATPLPLRLMLMAGVDAEGAALLVEALAVDGITPDGLIACGDGPIMVTTAMGVQTRERERLGNHVLDSAPAIASVEGVLRAATMADFDMLLAWEIAFLAECEMPHSPSALPQEMRNRLSAPHPLMWIWEVGGVPVAMTLGRPCVPVGRVGPVYTLPEHRRYGYAGALVGHVSAKLREQGCASVYLFTDLSNPTSNGVYRRIGYRYLDAFVHLEVLRS